MFRRKRSDTKVGTIEAQYGVDFGVRSDMKLRTLLNQEGADSLSELLGRRRLASWERAERKACVIRNMQHVGGAGAPDCTNGRTVVDVKHHARPVDAGVVRETDGKPWARGKKIEIVSTSGFTDNARVIARQRGIKLSRR